MAKQYKSKPSSFFIMGTICLLGFFSEFIMLQTEQVLYNKHYFRFTITESVLHWVLVCVLWGLIGLMMFYAAVRMYAFDLTKKNNLPNKKGIAASALLVAGAVFLKLHFYGGWRIHLDFLRSGWFQFIFQYIYYFFELFLTVITIALLQEWCERVFKNSKLPFGGIIFALTWGMSHIITQGDTLLGIGYILLALMFGMAYLFMNKNLLFTFIVVSLIFLV